MADKFALGASIGSDALVQRSISFTRVYGDQLDADGVAHPFEDVLIGAFRPARATRHYECVMPDENIRITRCEVMQQLISMSLYDFWLNGTASADPILVHAYVLDRVIS